MKKYTSEEKLGMSLMRAMSLLEERADRTECFCVDIAPYKLCAICSASDVLNQISQIAKDEL